MKKIISLILTLLFLFILNSCLQHQFKITVLEDGSVEYFYRASGDSSDLYDETTDLPSEPDWTIMRFTELDTTEDGIDTVYVLTAERFFMVDEIHFPDNFSGGKALLQHPLEIKKRDLLFIVNYTFDFSFMGRQMTSMYGSEDDYLPEEIISQDEGDLQNDSLAAVYKAQIKEGYLDWASDFYIKRFLSAVQKSVDITETVTDSAIMLKIENELKAYLLSELQRFELEIEFDDDAIWKEIDDGGYDLIAALFQFEPSGEFMDSVRKSAEFHRLRYNATNDLQDESFKIELEMPGTIKSSNADTTVGNVLTWEFDADVFMDSTKYLSALSTQYQYQFIYPAAAIILIIIIIILGWAFTHRKSNA